MAGTWIPASSWYVLLLAKYLADMSDLYLQMLQLQTKVNRLGPNRIL